MTFDEWWEDFVAEHDDWKYADSEALRRAAFQAGAASRDAEVVSLTNQRDYEYVRAENAEKERDQLRTEMNEWRGQAHRSQSGADRLKEENDQLRAQINLLISAIKVVEIDSEEVLDFDECTAMCVPMDAYHGLVEAAEATPEQSLVEYRNKVIEECAKRAEAYAYMSQNFNALAEELRAMKELQ